MNGSRRTRGSASARMQNPRGMHSSIDCDGWSPKVSAPDGFCRGEGGTPPGAGVTTRWPRLQGQRNCGELVPADSAVSKVFARTATDCLLARQRDRGYATSLPHTSNFKEVSRYFQA